MDALKRIDARLAKVESALLVASLIGVLVLGVLQIVLRPMGFSINWADEVMRNLTLWIGFVGASVATHEGKHINVDALTRFLKPKPKAIIALVVDLAASAITVLLLWSAVKLFASSVERIGRDAAAINPSGIPVAVWQAILPIAFTVIAARFILKAIDSANALRTGDYHDFDEASVVAHMPGSLEPHEPAPQETKNGGAP